MNYDINRAIIISIKSIHAEKIFSGDKKYELRKVAPKTIPHIIFIYETETVKAITGAFYVRDIISLPIDCLWKKVGTKATSKKNFYRYFHGHEKGVAYEIGRVYKFDQPFSVSQISDIQPDFKIPQSFAYLDKYPALESKLYFEPGIKNPNVNNQLSFTTPTTKDLLQFKDLVLSEISKNYDEIDDSFAEAIIKSHKLGYDPHGYFTFRKQIITIKNDDIVVGFSVLSYKITNAIKTGPTILLEKYRGRGLGGDIRVWIENYAANKCYRKIYCTCNTEDYSVVKYLLKSGMHIEAHLFNQYKDETSELVLGKLLTNNSKKYPLFFRADLEQSCLIPYDNSDYNEFCHVLIPGFTKSYLPIKEDFVQRLIQSTYNFKIDKYSSKGKIIFLGKSAEGSILSIIICSPKRGGAVKLSYISRTSNRDAFANSLSNILQFFKEHKRNKLYVVIPCSDYQLVRYFEDFGFIKEGMLNEPYQVGLDMIQLGYCICN